MRSWAVVAAVLVVLLLIVAAVRVVFSIVTVNAVPDWSAVGTDAHGDPLPEGAVARLGTVRFRTTTPTNLLWLADGRIASGGFDEEIVIWDARTGERTQVLAGHRADFVQPFEHWSWRETRDAVLHGTPPMTHDYLDWGHLAQHGERLISAGRTIREWDLRTGAGRLVALPGGGNVSWFVLRDDGRVLEFDRGLFQRRFDLATGEELERVRSEDANALLRFASSADGAWRAGHTVEGALVLVRTSDGSAHTIAAPAEDVFPRAACFSPDGTRLWCVSSRKGAPEEIELRRSRLVEFDVSSGAETTRVELDESGRWWLLTGSPDGGLLAAATVEGYVELRDPATLDVMEVIRAAPPGVRAMAFAPDSRQLALQFGGAVSIIDLDTRERQSIADAHEAAVVAAVFVDDGRVVTAGRDGELRAWEARTGRALWRRTWSGSAFPASAPRGGELAVATHEGLRMLRTRDGEIVSAGRSPASGVSVRNAAPDGTLLLRSEDAVQLLSPEEETPHAILTTGALRDATQGTQHELIAWDVVGRRLLVESERRTETGERSYRPTYALRLVDEQGAEVWSTDSGPTHTAAFSGELTAAGTYSGAIRVFDGSGVLVHEFDAGVGERNYALAFSSDGTRLAAGDWDRVVRVWSLTDGTLQRTLRGHGGHILALTWSPDGTLLVSGSADTSALVWDVTD